MNTDNAPEATGTDSVTYTPPEALIDLEREEFAQESADEKEEESK